MDQRQRHDVYAASYSDSRLTLHKNAEQSDKRNHPFNFIEIRTQSPIRLDNVFTYRQYIAHSYMPTPSY
jgi:hypothetical protein